MSFTAADRHERRKQQNRNAQKTHRERKAEELAGLTFRLAEAKRRVDCAVREKKELEIIFLDLAKALDGNDMAESVKILEMSNRTFPPTTPSLSPLNLMAPLGSQQSSPSGKHDDLTSRCGSGSDSIFPPACTPGALDIFESLVTDARDPSISSVSSSSPSVIPYSNSRSQKFSGNQPVIHDNCMMPKATTMQNAELEPAYVLGTAFSQDERANFPSDQDWDFLFELYEKPPSVKSSTSCANGGALQMTPLSCPSNQPPVALEGYNAMQAESIAHQAVDRVIESGQIQRFDATEGRYLNDYNMSQFMTNHHGLHNLAFDSSPPNLPTIRQSNSCVIVPKEAPSTSRYIGFPPVMCCFDQPYGLHQFPNLPSLSPPMSRSFYRDPFVASVNFPDTVPL